MNLNSSIVQWVLKWGLSKLGPFVASGASWLAVHILIWSHVTNFLPAASAATIQHGLESGANEFALSLVAIIYAWIVHRQSQGVKVLKAQLDQAPVPTPDMDLYSGAVGNNTLAAAAKVTGVPVEKAAVIAGVTSA